MMALLVLEASWFFPVVSSFVTNPVTQHCRPQRQNAPFPFSYQLLMTESSFLESSQPNGSSIGSGELELEFEREEEEELMTVAVKNFADREVHSLTEDEDELMIDPTTAYFASKGETTAQQQQQEEDDDMDIDPELMLKDERFMRMAIDLAESVGGERGPSSAYPNPTVGAVLVADDGRILGEGKSTYAKDAIQVVLENAGLSITPLREWCITWPSRMQLRNDLERATLYVTLEPAAERRGQALPPLTQLIELSGVSRVVIGVASPIPEQASRGAHILHQAGLEVTMGRVLVEECQSLIQLYTERVLSKLQCMARKHREVFHRPLGFLHCSVVDSSDLQAFAQHGNAFGKSFGGQILSERNFGSYEFAPPPEQIWADDQEEDELKYLKGLEMDDDDDEESLLSLDFDEEDQQERLGGVSMMPW